MTKNTKIILYTVGGVVTSAMSYFIYSTIKRKTNQSFGEDIVKPPPTIPPPSDDVNGQNAGKDEIISGQKVSNENWDLEGGMYGQRIYVMQSALKNLGKYGGKLDGEFGQKTREALKDYFYTACTFYSCDISYSNWKEIIDDARSKGWGYNKAWTEAKSLYKE